MKQPDMEASINNYLRKLSYEYYLNNKSTETRKIDTSLNGRNGIIEKLFSYFGEDIIEINLFGSYSRETILPRKFDPYSDIDVMILFDHGELQYTAETYRNQLKKFAELKYTNSIVYKSFPTVVLELNHIKFDLVPAIKEGFIFKDLKIPDKDNRWMVADPNSFDGDLTRANKRYGYIVKPVIRLLKAWNAAVGYPYQSYFFEKHIASLNYSGCDYQSGFFYAIDNLSVWDAYTQSDRQKIKKLKAVAEQVEAYLKKGSTEKAKQSLHKILP